MVTALGVEYWVGVRNVMCAISRTVLAYSLALNLGLGLVDIHVSRYILAIGGLDFYSASE